ncbi:MAG: hypothetical protein IIB28_00830 [Chloroflexi bacterium]|nr:hypothetical protein [Chloroflexota bacterium]
MIGPFWRSQAPLLAYFALSGTPLMLWAFSKLDLMFAVEFAIPGLLAGLGLQWLLDRGMLVARVEVVAAVVGPLGLAPGARQILDDAIAEARARGHSYVGTEHILLAFAMERGGVGADMLAGMNVESQRLLSALEFILGRDPSAAPGEPLMTPRAMTVLDIARLEAERVGHGAIEAEDILNAIVSEGEGASAGILESLGAEGSTMLQPDLRQGAGS